MSFEYHTEGTCARNIILEMDGDIIKNVQFIGGCNGQKAQDVIERVKGIQCGPKSTSCPDQLAHALEAYLSQR